MNPMRNVSVAVLVAALSALPMTGAFAATAPVATVTMGQKTDIPPAASVKPMIGKWTQADISALDTAKSVKVFDTKTLYSAPDLTLVATAETAGSANIKKFHDAINADTGLKAWFAKNKIDVNRVVGLSNSNGQVEIFLY
jgi:hypothetical protein